MTFLAALRHDRIAAPWLIEGPIDGESFRTYVEKVLVTARFARVDIVIMDNLRQPQGQSGAPAHPLRRRQAVLPAKILTRLNPIEQVFGSSSICCAKPPREPSKPSAPRSAELLGAFTAAECASYFRNSGYELI